ncbi:MAG TPA: PIN domain-containing protein [Chitinophagales bacterium]|nr:PIN domain-containing protein [Chitinophagales bacterium]
MRVLLDTNIIIHREAGRIINQDIGILFNWLDKLHYTKCVHPVTADELNRHVSPDTVRTMQIKLTNYQVLQTVAPLNDKVKQVSLTIDIIPNDFNDTKILNEVFCDRVDILISEDKKIHTKAAMLGISDKVFRIDSFLEKVTAENPDFVNYKVLAVKRDYFGNINLEDEFFDSFRSDYIDFDKWYNGKAGNNDKAYVCYEGIVLKAFLFLKLEEENENYSDIKPPLSRKRRLKIGTFKVVSNGLRIGERFLKIVFDNARQYKVDEIYVTIFDRRPELLNLTFLLEKFGFSYHGEKTTSSGIEKVYVRDFSKNSNDQNPKLTFPWLSKTSDVYIIPIRPMYHTELFPDSILRTESADDFVENTPHRNAISKVYVSHSLTRNLKSSDIIVFYRSGGIYKGVATTIGIVENVVNNIKSLDELIQICHKRTVLTEAELKEYWERFPMNRPFVINFLYAFSFVKRKTLKQMLDTGILPNMDAVKTITKINRDSLVQLITLARI